MIFLTFLNFGISQKNTTFVDAKFRGVSWLLKMMNAKSED